MRITSSAFQEGGMIPSRHTGDGEDVSPGLAWTARPAGLQSYVLICDDPDAPMGTWVQWVVHNIPKAAQGLGASFSGEQTLPDGTRQGMKDFRRIGHDGPCPPEGTHRYFFKLYALDADVKLKPGVSKSQLRQAMQGDVLAEARLMGLYQR